MVTDIMDSQPSHYIRGASPGIIEACRAGEDILPPEYGFAPILHLVDFEIRQWIFAPDATDRMAVLIA